MIIETKIASEIVKGTFSLLKTSLTKLGQSDSEINIKIDSHIKESLNWSSEIQFFGMSNPCAIDDKSVELDISSMPRKFRENTQEAEIIQEESILSSNDHFILLGSPGSGKTTTIKRLVRSILTTPPKSAEDNYQYPIVIRLRELKTGESLFHHIAKILGIKIRQEIIDSEEIDGFTRKEHYYYIGNELIEDAIPNILDNTRAIIFIDGLDEISKNHKQVIESQATALARKLFDSKVVMSCRSGDYSTHISGFSVIELCDLTTEQVNEIVSKWTVSPEEFLKKLKTVPYSDIANRPLLLTQLITLYNKTGFLPEQAIDIYSRIVRLLLEEWDQNRKIVRKSKYSSFSSASKKKFLSALSFELTYKLKTKRFSTNDLLEAYLTIYEKFDLEKSEAELVIEEIESHTGLIIKSGYSFYEFSHLSLQEYLCANYLVKAPLSNNVSLYLKEYPAPLAIAIALSAESGAWFSMVILSNYNYNEDKFIFHSLHTLLDRLTLEGVKLEESNLLGFSLLKLASLVHETDNSKFKRLVMKLLKTKQSMNSISSVLNFYTMDTIKNSDTLCYLSRRCGLLNEYELQAPANPIIPTQILDSLVSKNKLLISANHHDENINYFEKIHK